MGLCIGGVGGKGIAEGGDGGGGHDPVGLLACGVGGKGIAEGRNGGGGQDTTRLGEVDVDGFRFDRELDVGRAECRPASARSS